MPWIISLFSIICHHLIKFKSGYCLYLFLLSSYTKWKYTLLSISLLTIIHTAECINIITDTWNDDYIRSNTAIDGWLVTDDNIPPNTIDLVTQGTLSKYHGPFSGDTSPGTIEEFHLIQYFECAQRSDIEIVYIYSHCSSKNRDYLKLLFNDIEQLSTEKTKSDNCLDDDLLESVSTFCDRSPSCSSTVGPWSQTDVGPIILSTVERNEQFKIELIIGTNDQNDGSAISDLIITCISNTISTTTLLPTTSAVASTLIPTTTNPSTIAPTTINPTTTNPTTTAPTTDIPTTSSPSTAEPTTMSPTTNEPSTAIPTTSDPTTVDPTTRHPTTTNPTTSNPSTIPPTTTQPTTSEPTIIHPTTTAPTTNIPTSIPATSASTVPPTLKPTTYPTTTIPTTSIPSTSGPTTDQPTTANPTTTISPTTSNPSTRAPTTSNPTTPKPTTINPTTINPTTAVPTTSSPTTTNPTTSNPTTIPPTTAQPTTSEPTIIPTTTPPTTTPPTTNVPTSIPATSASTAPPTLKPTTSNPTTQNPTTTSIPTTSDPTTATPTTDPPTTPNTTINPTTSKPSTRATTSKPITSKRPTTNPTTSIPTTSIPTTAIPTTDIPTTAIPTTSSPTTLSPTTTSPITNNPTSTISSTTSIPATTEPSTSVHSTFSHTTSTPPATLYPTTTNDDERSQLQLESGEGQCNFTCSECLQQINVIGGGMFWELTFIASNETECLCPLQQALKQDNTTVHIGALDTEYELEIEKYVIINEDNDDESSIQYGLRLTVLYWNNHQQNCILSYFVNENEFFGIQAQNVLTITFTICDLPDEQLTNQSLQNTQHEYIISFAELFNISYSQVDAIVYIGTFCNDEDTANRRLLQSGKDLEVTVVVIFSEANDAKAAQQNACHQVQQQYPEINGGCHVQTQTEHDINRINEIDNREIISPNVDGLNALQISMIIVGIVAVCLILCIILYCYTSHKKKKEPKSDDNTSSKRGNLVTVRSHERIQSHNIVDSRSTSLHSANVSLQAIPMQMTDIDDAAKGNEINLMTDHNLIPSNTWSTQRSLSPRTSGHFSTESRKIDVDETIEIHIRTSTTITHDIDNDTLYTLVPLKDDDDEDEDDVYFTNEQMLPIIMDDIQDIEVMIKAVVDTNKANEIKMEDIIIGEKIGDGHFGTIYKAKWEGNVVVIKQLLNDSDEYCDRRKEMRAEIILASSLPSHNNLVQIFGYIESPFGVVMHYMDGGSVQKYVYREYKNRIPMVTELLIILQKAASGLKFLHKNGLIHRDIASRNILLANINNNNRINASTEVRISDFGLSRQLSYNNTQQQTQSNFGPLKWMAPESIKYKKYSKQSDVYMFGITMWEIWHGIEPYIGMNAANVAMNVVTKGERPLFVIDAIPNDYRVLMELCWNQKAEKRPSFAQIIDTLQNIMKAQYWD